MPRTPAGSRALTRLEPPPLPFRNRSFLSFLATQALGAFNDNVFKQVVLLLCVGYAAVGVDFQAIVQFAFALPFLVFSGLAGDLADRWSKGRLMVLCKVAEIGVMGLGVLAFLFVGGDDGASLPSWLWPLALVTFLMGTQSSFFGPPKYGGLPELVRTEDLAPATGLTQMTTFLAIIFGVAVAGFLVDLLGGRLWVAALAAVGIAGAGTLTSLGIARLPPTDPARGIRLRSFLSMFPTLARIVRHDGTLFRIMLVYSWFWLVGGVALPAANAYGRLQLGLTNLETSLLVSVLAVGIALGSALAGRLSRGVVRVGLVVPGWIGMFTFLVAIVLVPAHTPTAEEIALFNELKLTSDGAGRIFPAAPALARTAAFALLFGLGCAAGMFSVPLLAFVQARPVAAEKGRVFAAVNWFNWVFIVASAGVYGLALHLAQGRANLVLAAMGFSTILVGALLVPAILARLRDEELRSAP